jgi:hypothetical protein
MRVNAGDIPIAPIFTFEGPGKADRISEGKTHRPRKPHKNWRTERCELTLEQLVQYTNLLRSVTANLVYIEDGKTEHLYRDWLQYVEATLIPIVRAQGNLNMNLDHLTLLYHNLGLCIPSEETLSMMKDFYDRVITRSEELEHPDKARNPKPQKQSNVIAFSKPK